MEYSKQYIVLDQYTWLGRWLEGEKKHIANSASVEEVGVKVEAERCNLSNSGLVNVGLEKVEI